MLKFSKSNTFCPLLICSHNYLTFRSFWLNVSYTFVNNAESHPQNCQNSPFCFFLLGSSLSFYPPYVFVSTLFVSYIAVLGILFWFLDNSMSCLVDLLFMLFVSFELNISFPICVRFSKFIDFRIGIYIHVLFHKNFEDKRQPWNNNWKQWTAIGINLMDN